MNDLTPTYIFSVVAFVLILSASFGVFNEAVAAISGVK